MSSIPRLGYQEEAIGDFSIGISRDIDQEGKKMTFYFQNNLSINNEYFEKLYAEGKIKIIAKINSESIFLEKVMVYDDINSIDFSFDELFGELKIQLFIVAAKEFELETNNEWFDDFYQEKFLVRKSYILSKIKESFYQPEIVEHKASLNFIKIELNENQTNLLEVDIHDERPTLSIKDEEIYLFIGELNSKKDSIKNTGQNLILSSIYIECIRLLLENKLDSPEDYPWTNELSKLIGFKSLAHLQAKYNDNNDDQFDKAFQIFWHKFCVNTPLKTMLQEVLGHNN